MKVTIFFDLYMLRTEAAEIFLVGSMQSAFGFQLTQVVYQDKIRFIFIRRSRDRSKDAPDLGILFVEDILEKVIDTYKVDAGGQR